MRILILGGTTEASVLASRLSRRRDVEAVLSYAGRTEQPAAAPIASRSGGFGGAEGLAGYLRRQQIQAVVDATHPFAARMSANAAAACAAADVPLAAFSRPAWNREPADRWIEVADVAAAVAALGVAPKHVFLTIGRQSLAAFAAAPQHAYLVRTIDPPAEIGALPRHRLILARGPFLLADETALLRHERVDVVVSKNSGGAATHSKIEAARRLGLPVVMIARPQPPAVAVLTDVDAVLGWIEAHRPPS